MNVLTEQDGGFGGKFSGFQYLSTVLGLAVAISVLIAVSLNEDSTPRSERSITAPATHVMQRDPIQTMAYFIVDSRDHPLAQALSEESEADWTRRITRHLLVADTAEAAAIADRLLGLAQAELTVAGVNTIVVDVREPR